MPVRDPSGGAERGQSPCRRLVGAGHGEGLLGKLGAFDEPPILLPEPPHRCDEPKRQLDLSGVDAPADRGPQVRVVDGQPVEPARLIGSGQVRRSGFGQSEVSQCVPAPDCRLAILRPETLERESSDRLEHLEPDAVLARVAPDQALVDERRQVVEDITTVGRWFDDLGRLLVLEADVEDGEVMQDALQVGRKQIVAPGDGTRECPLPIGHIARTRPGQRKLCAQAVADRRQRKVRDARRSELDAQRQPIEERAHLVHDGVIGRGLPARAHGPGALREQPRAVLAETRHGILLFAGDPQWGAARHQDARPGRRLEDVGNVTGCVEQPLEVVEHEQDRAIGQIRRESLGSWSARTIEQPDRPGDDRADVGRVLDLGQRHEPRSVREPIGHPRAPSRRQGWSCRCRPVP